MWIYNFFMYAANYIIASNASYFTLKKIFDETQISNFKLFSFSEKITIFFNTFFLAEVFKKSAD